MLLAALVGGLLIATAAADSQARIVRLSDVQGDVQIDRNSGRGFEKAFLNMPITEGCKIWAKDDGRAEIEFEDGSVLRVVPDTKVDFSQLSLRDSGSRVSTIDVQQGTAYINFLGKKDDEFTVNFAHESARLMHAAHLRADVDDLSASLAVFKGDVAVQGPSGSAEVEKGHSASFDLMNNDRYTVARSYEEDPYDEWDKQAQQYHQRYSANSYDASIPYDYGVSDLSYYGSFINCPGYGYLWQPYFAGMGWSPFMDGAWLWVHLGVRVSLGMAAVSLRHLDVRARFRLGLAAGWLDDLVSGDARAQSSPALHTAPAPGYHGGRAYCSRRNWTEHRRRAASSPPDHQPRDGGAGNPARSYFQFAEGVAAGNPTRVGDGSYFSVGGNDDGCARSRLGVGKLRMAQRRHVAWHEHFPRGYGARGIFWGPYVVVLGTPLGEVGTEAWTISPSSLAWLP
jgi:hypothetical protein